MKQSEIEGIIEKRFGKINAAFENVRMHLSEDEIRLFRVKVKKLAARVAEREPLFKGSLTVSCLSIAFRIAAGNRSGVQVRTRT